MTALPQRVATDAHAPLVQVDERTLRRVHAGLTVLTYSDRARRLAILAMGEAWIQGYDVYPRDTGTRIAIVVQDRLYPGAEGRIELDEETRGGVWRWSDTGDRLEADPDDAEALVEAIDARLREHLRTNTVRYWS
ncbi:hypothetical protein [Nocardiopsis dassonvillei]|uniref:hypothetical protein n=1 Tax=Nocardiopsis dassonvillei TaxID=2014 RepID=UPI00366B34A1